MEANIFMKHCKNCKEIKKLFLNRLMLINEHINKKTHDMGTYNFVLFS